MNTAAITGNVATVPHFRVQGWVPTTTFDVRVDFARRRYTFHVRAMNNLAETSRHLRSGDPVAITGYLHAEPHDIADGSPWQRVEIVAYEIERRPFANDSDEFAVMIANPATVVLTAHVAHWADDHPRARTVWIIHCLHRHNNGDWGDLDPNDAAGNYHAMRTLEGRLLSSYPIPAELTDPTVDDEAIWMITDDVADPDPLTTVLWPSGY